MTVYEYGRYTSNSYVVIFKIGGTSIYDGKVDDIPYNLYARKIAKVSYDETLNCDSVFLY